MTGRTVKTTGVTVNPEQNNGASGDVVALDAGVAQAKEAAISLLPESVKGQAATLIASGLFADTKSVAQALVKIELGRALGINAVQAMSDVSIVQGRPFVGATLLAAAIKRSEKYDYRVKSLTATECEIEFFEISGESPEPVGASTYTMDDAKTAGMAGKDNYKKHPRNMLFARALSNGSRWFCPDAIGSAVYTFEEADDVRALPTAPTATAEVIEPSPESATPGQLAELAGLLDVRDFDDAALRMVFTRTGLPSDGDIGEILPSATEPQATEIIEWLTEQPVRAELEVGA